MSKSWPLRRRIALDALLVVLGAGAVISLLNCGGSEAKPAQPVHSQPLSPQQATQQRISAIKMWIEAFRQDNGTFPEPADPSATVMIDGAAWPCGGAMAIYQAITADGNDQLKGYRAHSQRGGKTGPSRGEIGWTKGTLYAQDLNTDAGKQGWIRQIGGKWMLVDAFGHPLQYRRIEAPQPDLRQNSESFHLWSYGNLKAPDDGGDARKSWIGNW